MKSLTETEIHTWVLKNTKQRSQKRRNYKKTELKPYLNQDNSVPNPITLPWLFSLFNFGEIDEKNKLKLVFVLFY